MVVSFIKLATQAEDTKMADRKQFIGADKPNQELLKLLEESRNTPIAEEELREQRISFAFGNAPASSQLITKESVRCTSQNIRLIR
jgi:hypothetical protein